MSHFTVIKTQFVDTDLLVQALADLGFPQVEVHETAQHLYGFQGDLRPQTAEVIVRRDYIGPSSNDIGFKRSAEGTFEATISEYDRRQFTQEWLDLLAQRYAYHTALAQLAQQGFDLVTEENAADGRIHLILRRTG